MTFISSRSQIIGLVDPTLFWKSNIKGAEKTRELTDGFRYISRSRSFAIQSSASPTKKRHRSSRVFAVEKKALGIRYPHRQQQVNTEDEGDTTKRVSNSLWLTLVIICRLTDYLLSVCRARAVTAMGTMSASLPGNRELPVSQYDLSTYWGRVRHAADISDPRWGHKVDLVVVELLRVWSCSASSFWCCSMLVGLESVLLLLWLTLCDT